MARSLGREDFVTSYKDWPLSSTLSATANTRRSVLADDLWPKPEISNASPSSPTVRYKGLPSGRAVELALQEMRQEGVPLEVMAKQRDGMITDRIVEGGGREQDYSRAIRRARERERKKGG